MMAAEAKWAPPVGHLGNEPHGFQPVEGTKASRSTFNLLVAQQVTFLTGAEMPSNPVQLTTSALFMCYYH